MKNKNKIQSSISFFIFLFFFFNLPHFIFAQETKNPFIAEWDDSVQQVEIGKNYILKVHFTVPSDHYLYQDKTVLKITNSDPLQLLKIKFPQSQKKYDPFLKKDENIFPNSFDIEASFNVPIKAKESRITLQADLTYQGCSSELCFRPMQHHILIPIQIVKKKNDEVIPTLSETHSTPTLEQAQNQASSPSSSGWSYFVQALKHAEESFDQIKNTSALYPFAFLVGLFTGFTPCVLPAIPLTLALMGFVQTASQKHRLTMAILFLLGLSITFCSLGMLTGYLGLKIGFLFQSRIFIFFLMLVFLILSLSSFGLFHFQMPLFIRNFFAQLEGRGMRGAFFSGLGLGFVASPCVGPLLGPLLLWVAQSREMMRGGIALFCYSLGLGFIFFFIGYLVLVFESKIHSAKWTLIIKKMSAMLLLLPFFYYAWVLWGKDRTQTQDQSWYANYSQALVQAKNEHKAMFIDFYADWCIPCKKIDELTLNNHAVQNALENFVKVKIDCTFDHLPACKEAAETFNVIGFPTLIFLDQSQQQRSDLNHIGGFISAEDLIHKINKIK